MQSMMASGQGANLLGLFGSGGGGDLNNNPLTQMATNNFTNNVSQKLGLNPTLVKAIAAIVIPMLIKKFLSRTNANPANAGISNGQPGGIDIQDIFNTISGGGTSGLNLPNILSRFTQRQQQNPPTAGASANPLDRDGDGDVDMQDLMGAFAGGGQQQQQTPSGGFLDLLKGLRG